MSQQWEKTKKWELQSRREARRGSEKDKVGCKREFPANPSKFTESDLNLQPQFSPEAASATYPKKIKTPGMSDKRSSKGRVFTCFVESAYTLLVKLLGAKLIKKIPFQQPDQPPKNFNPRVWCTYHSNVVGHPTNGCQALENKIQDLVDEGVLLTSDSIQKPSTYRIPHQPIP